MHGTFPLHQAVAVRSSLTFLQDHGMSTHRPTVIGSRANLMSSTRAVYPLLGQFDSGFDALGHETATSAGGINPRTATPPPPHGTRSRHHRLRGHPPLVAGQPRCDARQPRTLHRIPDTPRNIVRGVSVHLDHRGTGYYDDSSRRGHGAPNRRQNSVGGVNGRPTDGDDSSK